MELVRTTPGFGGDPIKHRPSPLTQRRPTKSRTQRPFVKEIKPA